MKLLDFVRRHPRLSGTLAVLLLLPAAAWADYASVERGNRLFREGELPKAIRTYREHVPGESSALRVSYNMGTAWFALGSPVEAETHLARAQQATDPVVRFRAYYNFAHLQYAEGMKLSDRHMSSPLLGEAVLAYREALRVDPTSEDARWNLALAVEALDSVLMRSIVTLTRIPTRADTAALAEADSALLAARGDASGERSAEEMSSGEEGGRQGGTGARETLAESADAGVPTAEEAVRALTEVQDQPSHMLRRILWLNGPKGWFGSAPPGGSW